MTDEEKCKAGICCDCGADMKKWTEPEIKDAKDDIGMSPEDDFADVCEPCMGKYVKGWYR
jgi:hypothetical protein